MSCPGKGSWFDDGKDITNAIENETYTVKYENSKTSQFYCVPKLGSGNIKYHFYVRGKGCEKCFELDAMVIGLAIIADVVITVVVMMIIYGCTKKNSSEGSSKASSAHPRPGGRGPPVPSPDYEHLNPRTRSQDPYSMLH
ncbi:T-cell surface glycoprotein CD3 epsilon chain [Xyrichtys novacula]|nr:T-cell surface glycoprotein CD3 epsilon chain [Xyrichtys novacula]